MAHASYVVREVSDSGCDCVDVTVSDHDHCCSQHSGKQNLRLVKKNVANENSIYREVHIEMDP